MGRRKKDRSICPLDAFVIEMMNSSDDTNLIDLCLSDAGTAVIASVPERYRLISLALNRNFSPAQLDALLEKKHHPKLYVRNYLESSIYYALQNKLTYEQWKSLRKEMDRIHIESQIIPDAFPGPSVTLNDIRRYVAANSALESGLPMTRFSVTKHLQNELNHLDSDSQSFLEFVADNADKFSEVRERTRYYFCKYLVYYLEERKRLFFDEFAKSRGENSTFRSDHLENAYKALSVFRIKTDIGRHSYTEEVLSDLIDQAPLTPYFIYAAYEDHYFGYVNTDWISIVLEIYGEDLPVSLKRRVAKIIKNEHAAPAAADDDAVIRWKLEETEKEESRKDEAAAKGSVRKPQSGRMGEAFIRDVIKGRRDLDRTTFIAFLLFFQKASAVPEPFGITGDRLDSILRSCGYQAMNDKDDLDLFFIDYLDAEDPYEFLTSEVESLAMSESNFYLYNSYVNSKSVNGQWQKVLEAQK